MAEERGGGSPGFAAAWAGRPPPCSSASVTGLAGKAPGSSNLAASPWSCALAASVALRAAIEIRSAAPEHRGSHHGVSLSASAQQNLTSEKYDESLRRLEEAGGFPPDGLEYHICFGPEGNMRVSEIWDSREQLAAFGEPLMPLLTESGSSFPASQRSSAFITSSSARARRLGRVVFVQKSRG